MHQSNALTDKSRIVVMTSRPARLSVGGHSEERFYIEDGWIFREHHGKFVECICRSDEIASLPEGLHRRLSG